MRTIPLFCLLIFAAVAARGQTNTNVAPDPIVSDPITAGDPVLTIGETHARVLKAAGMTIWPTPFPESAAGVMARKIAKEEAAGTFISDAEYLQFLKAASKK